MDTDGYIGTRTTVEITLSSHQLIEDFQQLIWSVGGIASIADKDTYLLKKMDKEWIAGPAFRLNIRHPDVQSLFNCSFKKNKGRKNQYSDKLKLEIIEIDRGGEGEATCITVDHSDKLFVTEDYLVTHNSQCVDVVFPAWELGLDTTILALSVSAAEGLMVDFLQATMNIIQ